MQTLLSLKGLILSVSAATLATFTAAAPTSSHLDPCGILGAKNASSITYHDVANCYKAIPFDKTNAATTLNTIYTLFNEFYIFRDAALIHNLPAPFTSPPTDVIKRIEKIARTKYNSDYTFHNDIRRAIASLNDAHASYSVNCYSQYAFRQPLTLYAPVIGGKQNVRIFGDKLDRGYDNDNCIVSTINNVDAISYLRDYTNDNPGFSHDGGVRLNSALGYQMFNLANKTFTDYPGSFAFTNNLPPTASIRYEVQCGHSDPIHINDEWQIISLVDAKFHDISSYIENICLPSEEAADPADENFVSALRNRIFQKREEPPHVKYFLAMQEQAHEGALAAAPAPDAQPPKPPKQQFPDAHLINAGNGTAFYQLKNYPDVGVIAFHTFDADPEYELPIIIDSLKALHDLDVTKLIIDFQGNPGGYVGLASNTVATLFPSNEELATNLASDLRVTPAIQALAAASFNSSGSLYDASVFVNFKNHSEKYTDDQLYSKPVTYTRGGRKAQYTQLSTAIDTPLSPDPSLDTFAWTNNAKNIRILTDGLCGSSCAIVSYFLTSVHKVEAYAVGGFDTEELSMYSFAGGTVSDYKSLQGFYKEANVSSPLETLPYASTVGLPILEIYGRGRSIPLEYDAAVYPAKHRLAFTPQNAHNRQNMWTQVASDAWK
ncbi:hypothetical protein FBU30_000225 [Linnemannia zychae]|nr:hypothetical protein FBU30_000225 [Linnemannia zychae]